MADVFVGPIIEKLIDIGFEYLKDQIRWQKGMKGELEKLQKNLPQIQSVIHYASALEHIKEKNSALNEWLWQLRDAIDEADDVMEELEYLKLEKQLTKTEKPRKVRSIMRSINKRLVQIGLRALKIDPTLKRLEEVVHKLDQVSVRSDTFLHLLDKAEQEHQEQQLKLNKARETGSSHTDDFIGRGKDKEHVKQWLRKTSNDSQTSSDSQTNFFSNISLLSIVGQGGMGKTTLLQQVYNESDENEFDLKIWACVSNDFDKNTVIKAILEFVTEERPSMVTFGALQKKLKSTVSSKKFLLVLDDIWEEDENKEMNKSKWKDVLAPLTSGKLGSKILVTTRMESVAIMLSNIIGKKNEMLRIEGLNDDECLQLLYNNAFNKGEDPTAYPKLRPIAEKIVKKLSGSPLATKVIGGVLSSELHRTHWNRVLNYKVGGQKGILDILKLSYILLPKVLRNCFSFCCTFPQDYEFDKDDLVRMWIALGFIQPDNTRVETLKDVGERYFDTLVQKSLFDKFVNQHERSEYYKLHDLLHEMLRIFSAQECCSIVGGEEELLSKTPKTIRYLFLKNVNPVVFRKVKEFEHLRSFILIYSESPEDLDDILAKIFKILKSIRLIYIVTNTRKNIPKEIEDLIHLQYLKINSYNKVSVSLPAFWRLPFLKYLFLFYMSKVKGFDYKFHGNEKVRVFPSLHVLHIERLKALEDWFVAKAAAYECLFPCLTELHLEYCSQLLELPALPPKLEKLKIDYVGWKGSNWLQGISSNCNISILNCPNLISLVGHQEMDQTTEKCHLILSKLVINDPSLLLKGPLTNVTSIQKLEIVDNNEVISFSTDDFEEWFLKVSSSLCKLKFTSLKSLQFLPSSLESLSSLKKLFIKDIPLLQQLPNMPDSLEELLLDKLDSLQCLPSLFFSSLQHLYLFSIPLLQLLPNLPPSLCVARLFKLSNLLCLPSCLPCLFSLKELLLEYLPKLRELPDLPPSLEALKLWKCNPELMKRYQWDTGSDWHKIAHIPEVEIGIHSVNRGVLELKIMDSSDEAD